MSDFELIRVLYESNSNWILYLIICNAVMFIIIVALIMALNELKKRIDSIDTKGKEYTFRLKGEDLISVFNKNVSDDRNKAE